MIDRPINCAAGAFSLMVEAMAGCVHNQPSLLHGSVAIAKLVGQTSIDEVDEVIGRMAVDVRSRLHSRQTDALIAHLHHVLFDELGFEGNTVKYHDPDNSSIARVLETKRGLPITLSLIYKLVAERVGIGTHGLGLPGHFCVMVETPPSTMIVDPFYGGRVMNMDEVHQRVLDTYGAVDSIEEYMQPVSGRHWLTRIMQNLMHTCAEREDLLKVSALLELEMVLWTDQPHLMRDLGLTLAKLGQAREARRWVGEYLEAVPNDPLRVDLEKLIETMR